MSTLTSVLSGQIHSGRFFCGLLK